MTVKRLMSEMDIPEMYEWLAFLKIEEELRAEQSLPEKAAQAAEMAKRRPR
jgi:hypothetical protein